MMRFASPHHPLLLPASSTSRKAEICKADIPPWKRLLLTTPTPRFEVEESSVAARQYDLLWPVRSITVLWIPWMQDAQGDRTPLHDEVDTLRRYLSFLCTTHEQERVEAHQALDRSEAHNRALEARIAVLETYVYRHE
nr:hypothetical protein [Tanacetum cinerariifolium]